MEVSLELLSAQLLGNFTVREVYPTPTVNQRLNLFLFIAGPASSTLHHRTQPPNAHTLVWIKSTSNSGQASELGTHHTSHSPEPGPWFPPVARCHPGSSSGLRHCPAAPTAAPAPGWPTTAPLCKIRRGTTVRRSGAVPLPCLPRGSEASSNLPPRLTILKLH